MDYVPSVQPADSYNGASHDNFTWSQSINDLDVLVNIPGGLTSPRDLKVQISAKEIKVEIRKNHLQSPTAASDSGNPEQVWMTTFEGQLTFPIKPRESLWSLLPGQFVHIHLEKTSERWWESLIIGEPNIQLDKIDCSKDFEDLREEEQMKLQELMWEEHEKNSKLSQ